MKPLVKAAQIYKEFYQLPLAPNLIGVFGAKDGHAELTAIRIVSGIAPKKIQVPTITAIREGSK